MPRHPRLTLLIALASLLAMSGCALGVPTGASDVTRTSITLHGNVYSNLSGTTTYWWVYGTDTSYGSETPKQTVTIAEGDGAHPVSRPIDGLAADTTYHYQLCVHDEQEQPPRVVCSKDQSFATTGDTASGQGSIDISPIHPREATFDFTTASGSHGENPDGYASTDYGPLHLEGPVTCLVVSSERATLGFLIDYDKSTIPDEFGDPEGAVFEMEDHGTPGAGVDRWDAGFTDEPHDCDPLQSATTLLSGDITLVDH